MRKSVFIAIPVLVLLGFGTWFGTNLFRGGSDTRPEEGRTAAVQEFYTCPMHPSVHSDRPGACPVCEMTLVKKTVAAQSAGGSDKGAEYYTCPMHPSVRSEQSGSCPVCQMALVKKIEPAKPAGPAEGNGESYTCPMHESVKSAEPGACPICGMTLVEKSMQEEMEGSDLSGLQAVSLSPMQRVMANVSTAVVERRKVSNTIHAVGVVSYAEPNYRVISMRFPGRVEKLFVTFAGQYIREGDPVAQVYSPDVIADEQAYLRALDSYRQTTRDGGESTDPVSNFLRQTREKLRQLGFTEKQIADLGKSETLGSYVMIYSPISGTVVKKSVDPGRYFAEAGEPLFDVADLSTVWILLDVYERDIRLVRKGLAVEITTEAYPTETFRGRVVFVDPVLTPETRTVRVRTEFPNPEGKLKPNMYVNAMISVPQPNALVVPTTAILPAGKRCLVWVEVKENQFEPREVTVGGVSGGFTIVLKGRNEGEKIAATGGFLIDSESALTWTGGEGTQDR